MTIAASPADRPSGAHRRRVVIIGGGFAGLAAARALRRADAEILLIDRRNHHVFQPLLYQVATAVLAPADIAFPLRDLERTQKNLNVLLAEVTGVDLAARTVEASAPRGGARNIPFDFLVVATGARPSYFGHDEFARHAPPLKSLTDAESIRGRVLGALEAASVAETDAERMRLMTFILVGAGPTGVEVAASLAQMMKTTLRGAFQQIDTAKSAIILVDAADRVLPGFPEPLARKVQRRLTKLDIGVLTGAKVEAVTARGVVARGVTIPSATVLWTAGVAASPLAKALGGQTDRSGRAMVDPFLQVEGAPGVFVVGDAACVTQDGRPTPGLAQAAMQEGRYVGRLIARRLSGRGAEPAFRYVHQGAMAVVGKNYAVLERGKLQTSGFLTWLLWAFVHLLALPQMQNRLRVQRQWLWSYFTGQRGSRLIPEPRDKSLIAAAATPSSPRSRTSNAQPAPRPSPIAAKNREPLTSNATSGLRP